MSHLHVVVHEGDPQPRRYVVRAQPSAERERDRERSGGQRRVLIELCSRACLGPEQPAPVSRFP